MKSKKLFAGMLLIIAISTGYSQQIGSGYPASSITNFNTKLLSGFYQGLDATGKPQAGWTHLLNLSHSATTNTYQLQISSPYSIDDKLYFRKFAYNDLGTYNPAWIEIATRGTNTFTGNQIINGSITASINSNEGGSISIVNPLKNSSATASKWKIYNMTGTYGNSLQFYAIANTCGSDGFCGPRMTLLDGGNVGIGTTTPNEKLEVSGNILVGGLGAGSDAAPLSKKIAAFNYQKIEAGAIDFLDFNTTRHSTSIAFRAKNASNTPQEFMRIVGENGNVGIGTTTPNEKLEVSGNIIVSGNILVGGLGAGSDAAPLSKKIAAFNYQKIEAGAIDFLDFNTTRHSTSIAFRAKNASNTPQEFMRIVGENGNVGIGTTSPTQKLEVIGNAKISGKLTLGLDTQITTIAGPANGGAIQIKPNALAGGGDNRYLRLGFIDNNSVFYPAISVADGLNVGIGTTNPDQKLTVKGKIHTEEVIVDLLVPADYVFQKYYTGKSALKADYTMPTLAEVETFTKKNHHLPNVPSAATIQEKGLQLGEMSNMLLQKIEELTIYVIEQNKKLSEQQKEIEQLKKEVRR